jgi:hypothetical protein
MSGHTAKVLLEYGVRDTDAFLPKPFTGETLAARIRELLEGQGT